MVEKKCFNCSGSHNTTDRNCPVFKKHMEIAKVMAFDTLFGGKITCEEEHQFSTISFSQITEKFPSASGTGFLFPEDSERLCRGCRRLSFIQGDAELEQQRIS